MVKPRPGRFTPRKKTLCPFYGRLGGPKGRSGLVRKISPPHRDSVPRPFQPVASRYAITATQATGISEGFEPIYQTTPL
jgi:hypothetical protein